MDQEGKKRTEDKRTHGKPLLASHRHADAISFDYFARNSSRSGLSLHSITVASPHVPFVSATMLVKLKKTCLQTSKGLMSIFGYSEN